MNDFVKHLAVHPSPGWENVPAIDLNFKLAVKRSLYFYRKPAVQAAATRRCAGLQPMRSLHKHGFRKILTIYNGKVVAHMIFAEKLKAERKKQGWSQEDLAAKLFVSRQSVSKWENGQNYPSIEVIIRISDLFGLTLDELLRSDEELTKKVIKDSKKLAYPRLKGIFDVIFMIGVILLVIKLGVLLLNNVTPLDLTLVGGRFLWNFGPLVLMVSGGIGSGILKEIYKKD